MEKCLLNYYRLLMETAFRVSPALGAQGDGGKSVGGREAGEDIVTVGREGVACRGQRERKKGDFDPLSPAQTESLPEGSLSRPPLLPAVSLSVALVRATYDA